MRRMIRPRLAQIKQQGCQQSSSTSAGDFARNFFLPHLGLENMKIESVGPAPDLENDARQAVRQQFQQLESRFPNTQMAQHNTGVDTADVRVSFQEHGRPMEGVVHILTVCSNNRESYPGMQPIQHHQCTAEELIFCVLACGPLGLLLGG